MPPSSSSGRRSSEEQRISLRAKVDLQRTQIASLKSTLSGKQTAHAAELAALRQQRSDSQKFVDASERALDSQVAVALQAEQRLAAVEHVLEQRDAVIADQASRIEDLLAQRSPAAATPVQERSDICAKRARAGDATHSSSAAAAALDKDVVIDAIFAFVGNGDYLYMAGVCRRWRASYLKQSYAAAARMPPHQRSTTCGKLRTSCCAVMQSPSRLQVAFDAGLTDKEFAPHTGHFRHYSKWLPKASLDPKGVLALTRLYGVPWTEVLTVAAATCGYVELLEWCCRSRCPVRHDAVLEAAAKSGSLECVQWAVQQLWQMTDPRLPGYERLLKEALWIAGCSGHLPVIKFLATEKSVPWPERFYKFDYTMECACWTVSAVEFAMQCGDSAALKDQWSCPSLSLLPGTLRSGSTVSSAKCATDLLDWGHSNGFVCTCNDDSDANFGYDPHDQDF